jgi:hypothetical protein
MMAVALKGESTSGGEIQKPRRKPSIQDCPESKGAAIQEGTRAAAMHTGTGCLLLLLLLLLLVNHPSLPTHYLNHLAATRLNHNHRHHAHRHTGSIDFFSSTLLSLLAPDALSSTPSWSSAAPGDP